MGERSGELGKETRRQRTTHRSGKATNEQHLTSGDRSEGTQSDGRSRRRRRPSRRKVGHSTHTLNEGTNGRMLKDDRVKGMEHRSLFAEKDTSDKLDDRRQIYARAQQ